MLIDHGGFYEIVGSAEDWEELQRCCAGVTYVGSVRSGDVRGAIYTVVTLWGELLTYLVRE
jgi:hypothetical protein